MRSGGSAISGENTSDFRAVRTPSFPDAYDRRRLVGRGLQPRDRRGLLATLGFASLAPLIREEFSLTRWQVGAITAIVFGGAAISSVPSGTPDWTASAHRRCWRLQSQPSRVAACWPRSRPGGLFFLLGVGRGRVWSYGLITPPTNVIVRGAPTTRHRSLLMSIKQVGVTIGGFVAGVTMPTRPRRLAARAARAGGSLPGGRGVRVPQPAQLARNAGDGREPLAIGPQHGDLPRPSRSASGASGSSWAACRSPSSPISACTSRRSTATGWRRRASPWQSRWRPASRPARSGRSSRIASSPRGARRASASTHCSAWRG